MATLQNKIELIDGVSPTLSKIQQGAINASKGMESIASSKQTFEKVTTSAEGLTQATAKMSEGFAGLNGKLPPINDGFDNMNNRINRTGTLLSRLKELAGSTFGQMTMANLAAGAISKISAAIAGLPGQLMSASDSYSGVQARLRLVVGAGGDVAAMNEAIFQSAIRARGSYTQMADAVSKIAMTAREAFPDPQTVVPFMEGIQKLFAIGGTDTAHQADALLQLTQALGSGKLQGDEFRSIAEAAPMIEQMVADYLHVSQGALKQLSSDGQLTAEVLKNAILENMDKIDAMFENIPLKWGDLWQISMTKIDYAMSGVYTKINDLANAKVTRLITQSAVNGVVALAGLLDKIMNEIQYIAESPATAQFVQTIIAGFSEAANTAQWFVNTLAENMDVIAPLLMGLAIAVGVLGTSWAVSSGIAVAGAVAHSIASIAETAAILGLTLAQNGLNAALSMCPLSWIIGLIVVLVGVFYLVIAAVNHFAGTSISATGVIFAVFAWLFSGIANMVIFVINGFIAFANFLGSVFWDPLTAIYNLFADIWNGVVELVANAVNSILALISKIPGMSGVGRINAGEYMLSRKDVKGAAFQIRGFSYFNSAALMDKGYRTGSELEKDPAKFLRGIFGGGVDKEPPTAPEREEKDDSKNGDGGAARETADNTGRMADQLDDLAGSVKDWIDLANQDAVLNYTKQEIALSVGDINPIISERQDIDGVIEQITEYITTGINTGAEFVHI